MVNLRSRGPGGGLTINEYIVVYYFLDTEKVGSQILTNSIQVLGLKAILLAFGRTVGLTSLGFATVDVLCSGVHETHSLRLGN